MSYTYDTGKHRPAAGRLRVYRSSASASLEHPDSIPALRRADRRRLWRRLLFDAQFGMISALGIIVIALSIFVLGVGS